MREHPSARAHRVALVLLLCGSAAAQAQTQDPRDIPPAPAPVTSPADTGIRPDPNLPVKDRELTQFERRFLDHVAHDGAAQIDASRLILERSQNVDVKNYAQMLVSDHGDSDQQLKQLAAAKNVHLPQGTTPEDKEALARLRRLQGSALDREYSERFGVQAHRQAVAHFERASKESRDEDLRRFIASMLPTLRRHQDMAEDLVHSLKTGLPLSQPSPIQPAVPMIQR